MSFFSPGERYCMSFQAIPPKRFTLHSAQEPASRIVAPVASAASPDVGSRKHVNSHGTRFSYLRSLLVRRGKLVSPFGSSLLEFSTSSLSPKRVGKVGDGCQRSEVTPAHWSSGLQAHLSGCLSGLLVGRSRDSLSCPGHGGLEAEYQGCCLP